MTKIDIFSGFLGAGKTTLIKKLIAEAFAGEKLVLIENEFGEIGIDGGFLAEAGVNITEMNSGCICCSLVGDFSRALVKVREEFHPDRILIEPSGVGKLSDVIRAVQSVADEHFVLSSFVTVVDAGKCRMYLKNFGEFFGDQVAHAGAIVLSHTKGLSPERVMAAVTLCREQNKDAVIVTTDWNELSGEQLLAAIERRDTLAATMEHLEKEDACPVCGHHHHHEHHHEHDHDEHCACGHDHHEHHHEHHQHHHDEHHECHEHHHEHHHEHGEHCSCGHDHHEHHHDEHCACGHDHHEHHHHADEVFMSLGAETTKIFTEEEVTHALNALSNYTYGTVLRAKGIVSGEHGWIHFDYVPGEPDVREGAAGIIGRLCVIGADLDREALSTLFGVELK